jgi:meso-butanediol dehydrogenase / (S,S)-butanediol dehydrogenase / diacetyl reductase
LGWQDRLTNERRNSMELKGRVAIVTGAVGAIGHGICNTLAGECMRVAVADLDQDQCNRFADELKNSGGTAMGVAVDVISSESTRKMVETVLGAYNRIDVLVNNAGIIAVAPLVDHREEDFDRVLNVNLKGAFLCAQAVVPHMIQNKSGRIVNVASVVAKKSGPLVSAYAASKHGLLGLTQVWCQELGPHNITVNAVCPGFVESPMWTDHLEPALAPVLGVDHSQLLETMAKAQMPLGRPQRPEDIGVAVAYFCRADNTSGQALAVDGGYTMS